MHATGVQMWVIQSDFKSTFTQNLNYIFYNIHSLIFLYAACFSLLNSKCSQPESEWVMTLPARVRMRTVKDINLTLIKLTLHATALYPPSAIHTLCPPRSSQYGDDSCFQFPAERLSKGQATRVLVCLDIPNATGWFSTSKWQQPVCSRSDMHQIWWFLIWSGLIWYSLWYVLNAMCMTERNNTLTALGWIKISHLKLKI